MGMRTLTAPLAVLALLLSVSIAHASTLTSQATIYMGQNYTIGPMTVHLQDLSSAVNASGRQAFIGFYDQGTFLGYYNVNPQTTFTYNLQSGTFTLYLASDYWDNYSNSGTYADVNLQYTNSSTGTTSVSTTTTATTTIPAPQTGCGAPITLYIGGNATCGLWTVQLSGFQYPNTQGVAPASFITYYRGTYESFTSANAPDEFNYSGGAFATSLRMNVSRTFEGAYSYQDWATVTLYTFPSNSTSTVSTTSTATTTTVPYTSMYVTASDPQDPVLRYWEVFLNNSPGQYLGSGKYQNNPTYEQYATSGGTMNFPVPVSSNTIYFVPTQSGGSSYGTYSGSIGNSYSSSTFSGLDAYHAVKVSLSNGNVTGSTEVALNPTTSSTSSVSTTTVPTTTVPANSNYTDNCVQFYELNLGKSLNCGAFTLVFTNFSYNINTPIPVAFTVYANGRPLGNLSSEIGFPTVTSHISYGNQTLYVTPLSLCYTTASSICEIGTAVEVNVGVAQGTSTAPNPITTTTAPTTTIPQSTTTYYTTTVPTTTGSTTTVNFTAVFGGPFAIWVHSGWNLISVPFEYVTNVTTNCEPGTLSQLWELLGGQYSVSSIMYGDTGYWLYSYSSQTCVINFSGPSSPLRTYPHLVSGWNLIGIPGNSSVQFSSIAGSCDVIAGPLWYDPVSGEYVNATSLSPSRGYFIDVGSGCSLGEPSSQQGPPAPP